MEEGGEAMLVGGGEGKAMLEEAMLVEAMSGMELEEDWGEKEGWKEDDGWGKEGEEEGWWWWWTWWENDWWKWNGEWICWSPQ